MSLQSFPIFAPKHGLQSNTKPVFFPDDAWSELNNAYIWREQVIKREGLKLLGRLTRNFIDVNVGFSSAGTYNVSLLEISGYISNITQAVDAVVTTISPHLLTTGDTVIFSDVSGMTDINGLLGTITVIDATSFSVNIDSTGFSAYTSGGFFFSNRDLTAIQPDAEIVPGSVIYTIHDIFDIVFTDQGNGLLTSPTGGNSGYINYTTGILTITTTAPGNTLASASFSYYTMLPVMGIPFRDLTGLNNQQTIWFDEQYAYVWTGSAFVEFIPGFTWNSTDSDFFWGYNYRGASDNNRLFFETNFVNSSDNPMRYTDGTTWIDFAPAVTSTQFVFTARIIVAYFGRLILLNTWEGTDNAGAVNFFNRARFNQYSASPIASDTFRSDIFGKGGFLDAPTNEAIVGATFVRNTLIVKFEQSTWQLRYVGEYGLPFIWERTSSDFGSECTFSSILFDNHMLSIGDKAITADTPNSSNRIDLDIPDLVFDFRNGNDGEKRIFGARHYQKELVYWNYVDSQDGNDIIFPNKVLLYNYRNNTWAIFRDSVTAFGTFQNSSNITWDSLTVSWDSDTDTWDDVDNQTKFPDIVSGNQQGFVHIYQGDAALTGMSPIQEWPSLSVTDIDLTVSPITLTIPNHNLLNGEVIYLTGLMFLNAAGTDVIVTDLNDNFYSVQLIIDSMTGVDANKIEILKWDGTNYAINFAFTPTSDYQYVGGGLVTLVPKLNITTKDINIYQAKSLQTKLSRLDFLMQPSPSASQTVNILPNATSIPAISPELAIIWSNNMSTVLTPGFYPQVAEYTWFRFYATIATQYFRINVTYSDALMNLISTHSNPWRLLAINAWCRPGGKNVF